MNPDTVLLLSCADVRHERGTDPQRCEYAFHARVSGHRDLTAGGIADLRDAVARFVNELHQLLPDTPLRILVGMADGADLVVAQTAVDLGVAVEACCRCR